MIHKDNIQQTIVKEHKEDGVQKRKNDVRAENMHQLVSKS